MSQIFNYFNNNILLNQIQNTNATNGTPVKNIHEHTIYRTYLHTKPQNIDIVEHLHLKLLCESSKIGVFLLIFLNI